MFLLPRSAGWEMGRRGTVRAPAAGAGEATPRRRYGAALAAEVLERRQQPTQAGMGGLEQVAQLFSFQQRIDGLGRQPRARRVAIGAGTGMGRGHRHDRSLRWGFRNSTGRAT